MSAKISGSGWSRREVIQRGGIAALALGGADLLAACGGSSGATASGSPASTGGPPTGGTPVRGGTITLALLSGGQTETLIPGHCDTETSIWRCQALFDPLFSLGPDLKPVPYLAESAEPNADATVWTVKVRSGVTWHDGKPLTADDVATGIKLLDEPTKLLRICLGDLHRSQWRAGTGSAHRRGADEGPGR